MKQKFTTILFLLLLFNVTYNGGWLNAQGLLLEENFNMVAGTELSGQNNWKTGTSGTNKVTITSTNLSYPNYKVTTEGSAAYFTALSDRIQKDFTGPLADTYYYSFLINVSSAGTGDFFVGLFSGSAFRGRAYLKADGDGFQIGLAKTTTGTVAYTSQTPLSFGTTHLVVVKYEFVSGSANDKVSLFLNPDFTKDEPESPTLGALTDGGNDATANVFAIQARQNAGDFIIDGIKIAQSWGGLKGEEYVSHNLELPRFISSNMVMQRDVPLKLWGWGHTGDKVDAEFIRQDNSTTKGSAIVNSEGKWNIELSAQAVSKDACKIILSVDGHTGTKIELENILIGDVWFCGGQSNMEKKVNHLLEVDDYVSQANSYPLIRSFRAAYNVQVTPQDKVNNSSEPWFVCNSDLVADKVSAIAYVCARDIFDSTDVPIGLVQSYRGGTELETWMSSTKLTGDPELSIISGRNTYIEAGKAANAHSVHYNGQIHPLVGYPLKGFLWYQGESNTKRAPEYRFMMKKLIEDWRSLWNQGDLPFYYVQMFNIWGASEYEESNWADIRDQQSDLLFDKTVANIGMCISIDTNEDPTNSNESIRMHPRNKKPVGQRLARIILKDVYNADILAEGPVLNGYTINDNAVHLYFKNYGDGLKIKDGESTLKGFVVCGDNKQFKSATASIINDSTVVLQNDMITTPTHVRYAWARNPICNLHNSENLPARPFRTDDWELTSYSIPQSSSSVKSPDSKLATVRINGRILEAFDPTILTYDIASKFSQTPTITTITNNPFAKASVLTNAENSVQVKVTAEDGSSQIYVFNFTYISSIKDKKSTESKIIVSKADNNNIAIKSNNEEDMTLKLYSLSGQCLVDDVLKANRSLEYNITDKIVLLKVQSKSYTESRKIILDF